MILTLVVALLVAQAPADFTGKWTAEPPADMGTGWGSTITIAQDARQLSIEYVFFSRYDLQPNVKLTYALDGSESKNSLMLGRGNQEQVSRASWSGQALSIVTTSTVSDPTLGKPFTTEVTHTLRLESPATLVVEVTRNGALGGAATKTTTAYKKS